MDRTVRLMLKDSLRLYGFGFLILVASCNCDKDSDNAIETLPIQEVSITNTHKRYYNLEAIDCELDASDKPAFSLDFNGKPLVKEDGLYVSNDLIVYQNEEGKWQATVIGPGGIESSLQIRSQGELIQEIPIQTTSEVFPYQDALGPEWPGMHNIGNTCFANALYKLIARCLGFDSVLSQDMSGGIHTALRNVVNGIRLGKRSALNTAMINKEVSKQFLKLISEISHHTYQDGKQNVSLELWMDILESLYKDERLPIESEALAFNINQPIDPFTTIVKWNLPDEMPEKQLWPVFSVPIGSHAVYFYKPPLFFLFPFSKEDLTDQSGNAKIPDTQKLTLHDHETDQPNQEKHYELIGFTHASGNGASGHSVAYINLHDYGWYLHNDWQVAQVLQPSISDAIQVFALYQLKNDSGNS